METPRDVYIERLAARREEVGRRLARESLLSWARLGIFLAGFGVALLALVGEVVAWGWLVPFAVAFVAVLVIHDRVIRWRRRAERAARFYERGLARLENRWAGNGNPGDEFHDPEHPYSGDLDLFGRGSLFELLCTARTRSGERTLASWLQEPAGVETILARQEAVDELRPLLDLREDLAVLGAEARDGTDPDRLAAWAIAEPVLVPTWPAWLAAVLALTNAVTLIAWVGPGWSQGFAAWLEDPLQGSGPFMLSALLGIVVSMVLRGRVERALAGLEQSEHDLELLSGVLARLERRSFESTRLRDLRAALDSGGHPPSNCIRRLAVIVDLELSRHNHLFAPFAALALLRVQLAFALERWRRQSGAAVVRWLESVGEIEALSSLAGYGYERPDDVWPELVSGGPRFEATGIGHPLLVESTGVRNDVELDAEPRLLLVSGSNMSGKSTLLRTIGVNTVLALAGAPVRARELRLSPLAVAACMRFQDSLQRGLSHFYAELRRLRQVIDRTEGPLPVLFLLDEILHGTNSHDRRIGAEALIRELLDRGAVGLVTTHDLALAEVAETLSPVARNVHFVDELDGDEIRFDYKLREGVVQRGNALGLMRAVGLIGKS